MSVFKPHEAERLTAMRADLGRDIRDLAERLGYSGFAEEARIFAEFDQLMRQAKRAPVSTPRWPKVAVYAGVG